jgi:hypothetical protein
MPPAQIVPVFRADDFRAVDGANLGDPLSFAAELILDDAYALPGEPEPQTLAICPSGTDGALEIAAGGTLGTPGARLHLDSCLTLMPANGNTVEALVLVELSGAEATAADAVYVMPLASIAPREEYRLVGIDRASARRKLAQYACVALPGARRSRWHRARSARSRSCAPATGCSHATPARARSAGSDRRRSAQAAPSLQSAFAQAH